MSNGVKFEVGVSGDPIVLTPVTSAVELDMSLGNNFDLELTTNMRLDAPINVVAGQSGRLIIRHDGTRSIEYDDVWLWQHGYAPDLTDESFFSIGQLSAVDMLVFETLRTSPLEIAIQMIEDMKSGE